MCQIHVSALMHAGAHPAERVESVPLQLPAELLPQFLQHLLLSVCIVQVAEIHQRFAHRLVLLQRVRVSKHVPHYVAVLISSDQNFFWLHHALNHEQSEATQHIVIEHHAWMCACIYSCMHMMPRATCVHPECDNAVPTSPAQDNSLYAWRHVGSVKRQLEKYASLCCNIGDAPGVVVNIAAVIGSVPPRNW